MILFSVDLNIFLQLGWNHSGNDVRPVHWWVIGLYKRVWICLFFPLIFPSLACVGCWLMFLGLIVIYRNPSFGKCSLRFSVSVLRQTSKLLKFFKLFQLPVAGTTSGACEVKFQVSRDTLGAVLRSMAYIREQLSGLVSCFLLPKYESTTRWINMFLKEHNQSHP